MTGLVLDANYLVAVVDATDTWHRRTVALRDAIVESQVQSLTFDIAYLEAVTVLARRAAQRTDTIGLPSLLDSLASIVPLTDLAWISPAVPRLVPAAIDLVISSDGRLNVNDALIALACREAGLQHIASFDTDFDEVPWLTRLSTPEQVLAASD